MRPSKEQIKGFILFYLGYFNKKTPVWLVPTEILQNFLRVLRGSGPGHSARAPTRSEGSAADADCYLLGAMLTPRPPTPPT